MMKVTQNIINFQLLLTTFVCMIHHQCHHIDAFTNTNKNNLRHSFFQLGKTATTTNNNNVKNKGSINNLSPPGGIPPSPPRKSFFWNGNDDNDDDNGNKGSMMLLKTSMLLWDHDHDQDENNEDLIVLNDDDNGDDEEEDQTNISTIQIRGGSSNKKENNIIAGSKSTLQTVTAYWSNALESASKKIQSIFKQMNPFSKKDIINTSDDDLDLSTLVVQQVEAPSSTVLPDTIVRSAAQRSGLIGSVMRSDRVKECANQLKRWYLQRGYVLHSVTGATLHAENSTATLAVYEPRSASLPVDIQFAKLVPIDPESGDLTTLRKLKTKLETKKRRALKPEEWNKIKSHLNMTLIEAKGRTNPKTISKRLELESGNHFRWNAQRWQTIAQSGIFAKVFRASPVKLNDGSVQLQIVAQESPPRNLEYGIQKSLYTGNWEGEIDFKHENILGGGESLGVSVRRGATDPEPSIKIQFTDDKFGMTGGYDAQLFNEYIAMEQPKNKAALKEKDSSNEDEVVEVDNSPAMIESSTYNDNEIQFRKGFRMNFRNVISTKILNRSSAAAALERTTTRTGRHETIASGTVGLGPIVRNMPLGARTSVSTSITSGTRIGGENDSTWRLFPYTSQVSTARQLFPIFSDTLRTNGETIKLAIETTLMSSTKHLPRHEANAAGLAARVRGHSSSLNGPLKASLYGTAEVRIPVTIPFQKERFNQDGKVVLFGDWMFGMKKNEMNTANTDQDQIIHKSSVGIGLRKSLQGIPLKYDISFSKEGKIGAFFGLGHDWSIE